MKKKIQLQLFLDKSREREYIRLPFSVDADTESISIRYRYLSSFAGQDGPFVIEGEPCTIDLAVMMPDGRMAGSSGSEQHPDFPFGQQRGLSILRTAGRYLAYHSGRLSYSSQWCRRRIRSGSNAKGTPAF